MKKKILSVVLALTMIVGSCQIVGASPLSNAKSGLNTANEKISSIESKQSALQSEIDALDSELVSLLVDIDVINGEISGKEKELKKAQADLKVAQAEEKEQYEAMKKRIKFMYEAGDNSILTALLSSNSIVDVINKVSYFNEIYDYDRNLLNEYQATKAEVESLVAKVEEDKSQLEESKDSLKEQQASLEKVMNTKKSEMADFDSQLAEAKALAAQYKQTIDEQNAILSQQASTGSVSSGSSGKGSSDKGNSSNKGDADKNDNSSGSSSSGSTSGSKSGQAVANYACQFVGNPYKWGGTSLTNGADCSGFVMSVYRHFGVSLPHSSSALRGVGRGVSVTDMQPGDIVCYSGHVAIYIGGNTIVHASNKKDGIKYTSPANYRSILAVRRIF